MKRIISTSLFILLLCISSFAQTDEPEVEESVCPKVQITEPASAIKSGETATFTITVLKESNEKYPIIDWSLDKGIIISGQGTSSITVDTSGLYEETFTAIVKVETSKNCRSYTSGTANISGGRALLFAIVKDVDEKELKRRFDLLLKKLSESQMDGYVVTHGAKEQAMQREKLFRSLIGKKIHFEKRIIFVYGGEDKDISTRFWLASNGCPSISVTSPSRIREAGEIIKFTLDIENGRYDPNKIKIEWLVEGGNIVSGQGTRMLGVLTYKEYTDGMLVKVTAKVSGFSEGCSDLEVAETAICPHCGTIGTRPILIDEFGNIPNGDKRARFDALIVELQNTKSSRGYIINYGSTKDIEKREKEIRDHWRLRNYDVTRIVFVNGGKEKTIRTRFWLVPPGADASSID